MNLDFLVSSGSKRSEASSKRRSSRQDTSSSDRMSMSHSRRNDDDDIPIRHGRSFMDVSSVSSPNLSLARRGSSTSSVGRGSSTSSTGRGSSTSSAARHQAHKSKKKHRREPLETETVSTTDSKHHKCSTCGKGFYKLEQMKRHYRLVHLNIRPFKCVECELSFGTKQNLEVHRKTRKHRHRVETMSTQASPEPSENTEHQDE